MTIRKTIPIRFVRPSRSQSESAYCSSLHVTTSFFAVPSKTKRKPTKLHANAAFSVRRVNVVMTSCNIIIRDIVHVLSVSVSSEQYYNAASQTHEKKKKKTELRFSQSPAADHAAFDVYTINQSRLSINTLGHDLNNFCFHYGPIDCFTTVRYIIRTIRFTFHQSLYYALIRLCVYTETRRIQ